MSVQVRNTSKAICDLIDQFSESDPATLYEAAGQRGMIDPAIRPAWAGAKICGLVVTVECPAGDNLMLHRAVTIAQPGEIIVANAEGYLLTGAWGEILTVAAQTRGIGGLAIDGAVRDIEAIEELRFPIFSRGLAIGGCTKKRIGRVNCPISFGGIEVRPGDIIVGNVDGLVIIDQDHAAEVYQAAVARRDKEQEIMESLRAGKTTVELLGLTDFFNDQENTDK